MEKLKCSNQVLCGMQGLDEPSEPPDIDKAIKILALAKPPFRYYGTHFEHPKEHQTFEEYFSGKV